MGKAVKPPDSNPNLNELEAFLAQIYQRLKVVLDQPDLFTEPELEAIFEGLVERLGSRLSKSEVDRLIKSWPPAAGQALLAHVFPSG